MSVNNLPSELLAKATVAMTSYASSEEGRDADVYFNAGDIARVALIAADVPGLLAELNEARKLLVTRVESARLDDAITECDALRAALAAVVADYTSLLQSEYQTRNNPDPAADKDSIREARRLLEGKEIR